MEHIVLCLIGLVVSINLSAQKIHVLPADPAIKNGVLPNGMTYYVASNPDLKGMADFALVQRVGASNVDEVCAAEVMEHSQSALASQPRVLPGSVQDFFLHQGVEPGRKGFVEVTEDGTAFRFKNVMVARNASVVDSTLLVLFNMADMAASEANMGRWYSPADHAVVVAGDVDAAALIEKMKMLSYMIPAAGSLPRKEYSWTERDEVELIHKENGGREIVEISAEWRLQRTPRQYMNTVQPAMLERFLTQLGIIAEKRVADLFRSAGVPLADISYQHTDAAQSLGDERFRMSISVRPADLSFAVRTMASVMGALDKGSVSTFEINRSRRIYLDDSIRSAVALKSNKEYVDRCISAFIHNASLASRKSVLEFQSSHILDEAVELKIFNSITSAALDPHKNIILTCDAPDVDMAVLAKEFEGAWSTAEGEVPSRQDVTMTIAEPGEPMKLKSSKKEYMSGGTMWVLANGMRVIFKKMPAFNGILYSLSMNGGYGNINNLQRGEAAYISDYIRLCRVGGVPYDDFRDLIMQNGLTMDCEVNLSNTIFKGHVQDDKLDYLLQMLAAVMYDRTLDREALDYYLACEPLRIENTKGSVEERIAAIDSVLCPDYRYTSCRIQGVLKAGFADRAEAFMKSRAEKMNDGVLILMGDVDEKKLKAALTAQASRFKTSDTRFVRPVVKYQPVSGSMLYTADGENDSVDIVMSVPLPLTSDNYYTAAIASMVLRKRLSEVVSGKGMYLNVTHRCMKYPQERFNIMITLEEASVDGYAPGTAYNAPMEALKALRTALSDMESINISKTELDFYKALLKKSVSVQKTDPEYWLKSLSMRYLDGKDFVTGCDARIDAISAEKVKALLLSLKTGSKVEYIINGK